MSLRLLREIARKIYISKNFEKSYSERYDLKNNNKFLSLPKPRTNSMVRTFGYAAAKI